MNQRKDMHQGLNFSGVNDHHQNDQANWRIISLHDLARCQIIHSPHWWTIAVTANLWPYAILHAAVIINETHFRRLNYTSTPIYFFCKSSVYYITRYCQPLFFPVYAISFQLDVNQHFDKCKCNITPGIYLIMSPIHARTVTLIIIFSNIRVSPQFHVSFDPSFATTNGHDGNLVLPSYWQDMCGFIKGNKLVFVNSDQHDPSSTFIYPADQVRTTI